MPSITLSSEFMETVIHYTDILSMIISPDPGSDYEGLILKLREARERIEQGETDLTDL